MTYFESLNIHVEHLEKTTGGVLNLTLKNGDKLILANRGLRLFPKRAILL